MNGCTDMKFLKQMLEFDKDAVNEETIEFIQPYLEQEDFNVERARMACGSLAGLTVWISSMKEYYFIARDFAPKRLRVQIAEEQYQHALIALNKAEGELAIKQQ
eukprot:gene14669-4342_t